MLIVQQPAAGSQTRLSGYLTALWLLSAVLTGWSSISFKSGVSFLSTLPVVTAHTVHARYTGYTWRTGWSRYYATPALPAVRRVERLGGGRQCGWSVIVVVDVDLVRHHFVVDVSRPAGQRH